MAIHPNKSSLLQRLANLVRSNGVGGKTTAQNMRDFLGDFIDTVYNLIDGVQASDQQSLAWDSTATYNTTDNQFASAHLRIYKSKQDGNIGHEPPSVPDASGNYEDAWWVEVSAAPASGIVSWAAGLFGSGLVIVEYNDRLYKLGSTVARPFESTDITTEITAGTWVDLAGSSTGSGGPAVAATYADIPARDADVANRTAGELVKVTDASADLTVDAGYAYYEFEGGTSWRKLSEEESMDVPASGGDALEYYEHNPADNSTMLGTSATSIALTQRTTATSGVRKRECRSVYTIPSGHTGSIALSATLQGGEIHTVFIVNNNTVAETITLPSAWKKPNGLADSNTLEAGMTLDVTLFHNGTDIVAQGGIY